jgi:hypothetical protein
MTADQTITPADPDRNRGVYAKFSVERTDPGSAARHQGCDYFVLDITHDPHAAAALTAYADSCRSDFPALAADLDGKAGRPDVEPVGAPKVAPKYSAARTEPTAEEAAEAACRATHPTRWEHAILSHPCDNCTAGARAVLALLPQRCAPSVEEIARRLHRADCDCPEPAAEDHDVDYSRLAEDVAAVLTAQPTVREAKAAGWDEGYRAGEIDWSADDMDYSVTPNPYRSEADHG